MTPQEKLALRTADVIRPRLGSALQKNLPVSLPAEDWGEIVKLAGQIEKAAMRGWLYAAEKLRADLARNLEYCRNRMDRLCQGLQKPPPNLPSLAEIYGEISALYGEFEEVEIDIKGHTLAVTTEPVVLDWLRLGAFKIRLDWNELGKTSPYRVVALDPNPAAGNDGVTHPHVQNGRLCEGEAGRVFKTRGKWPFYRFLPYRRSALTDLRPGQRIRGDRRLGGRLLRRLWRECI